MTTKIRQQGFGYTGRQLMETGMGGRAIHISRLAFGGWRRVKNIFYESWQRSLWARTDGCSKEIMWYVWYPFNNNSAKAQCLK